MQGEAVVTREAEFAGPGWMFGSRSYQVLPDGRLAGLTSRLLATAVKVFDATPSGSLIGSQWAGLGCHALMPAAITPYESCMSSRQLTYTYIYNDTT